MKLSYLLPAIAGAFALTIGASVQAQNLLGQDIHAEYLFPSQGSLYENDGTQTVTAGGVTFNSFGQVLTTVTPNQIIQTFTLSTQFTPAAFNGVHLSEVGGSPIDITSVTINPSTFYPGFDASRISFDAHNIYINDQSLGLSTDYRLVLDVNGGSAVPEPGTYAMIAGMGVTGSLFALRRLRRQKK